ncbi:MAG TPA: RHS repeat-associated core domain-containing protein, partial [Terriglobia bacterium]|nr:RHS repeat-associated core domain-containing protein [Terriglobia bacterium]
EIFDDWPSQNWAGADVFDARVAGERLQMGGSSSYLLHADAVGSTTMATDQAGTVDMDNLFYPWGQVWQQTGPNIWASFADLGFTNVGDVYPAEHRDYQATLGRWLVPDPAGQMAVDPANPQTWNMYAYVGDNPTTLNDPSGLDWVWVGGCAHYSATTDFYTSVAGYADKTYRGSYTYSMSMGQCSGIADGDYNRIGPTPNTSGQYRSRNAMYVAAQQASWWATFANSLFSWKNFTDEFKQGGCVHDFGEAIKKQMHEVGEVGKETKEMAERVAQGAPGLSGAGLTIGGSAGVLLFSAGQKLQSAAEYVGSRAPEVATGYGDYVLGNALSKELSDMGNGGCH